MAAVAEKQQTVQAVAKFVRISPRKARLVTDNIRGRSVPEARTILAFTERAAAIEIEKVLSSAVANAESNPSLQWRGDDLVVAAVFVDGGPTIKRWRARSRPGRPHQEAHVPHHDSGRADGCRTRSGGAGQAEEAQVDREEGELS